MTTQAPVYGLIEWDGSYRPTVIAGCCYDAVIRDIVAIFTTLAACGKPVGSRQFRHEHPLPNPQGPVEELADWLDLLHEDTTVPYVTLMDSTEIVTTGDQLLVMNWYAANRFYSLPGPPQLGAHHRLPTGCQGVAAPTAVPAVVNGYPVVAAVAERDDAASWIVICRRTQPMPDWAGATSWYVTWRVWWAHGRWQAENGDYGPHHGLTWPQAQQSMLRRLHVAAPKPAPQVNPDVYLASSDEGDALTCPACHQPITWLDGGDKLGSLLTEITADHCETADDATTRPGIS